MIFFPQSPSWMSKAGCKKGSAMVSKQLRQDFPSFAEFCDLADGIIRQIPEMYKEGISGIFVTRKEVKDEEVPELYILGHYHHGGYLTPFINIYYGSFRRVCKGAALEEIEEELWETITHEIRHHLEENAGLRNLKAYDEDLKEYFRGNK